MNRVLPPIATNEKVTLYTLQTRQYCKYFIMQSPILQTVFCFTEVVYMNEIQIFKNEEFGDIRTIIIDGEPWFVGRDLAIALGYKKPETTIRDRVPEEDTAKYGTLTNGGTQQLLYVNESGMYALIFGSKLESSKKFKKWVTSEVLPSIRKTGGYNVNALPQTTDGKIALLAQGHIELKEEVDKVKQDLESLRMDLPILPIEAERITEAVRKRGVAILGGKQSSAYNNKKLRQKLYNNLYANLKYNFGIRSYKSLKRSQTETAIDIVGKYEPPFFLSEMIENENAQQKMTLK